MEDKRKQLTPEEDALEHIVACRDKSFLEERYIDSFKGRGVFTHRAIKPSKFVVEYRGNIFSHNDTRLKTKCGDAMNNYLFEFSWGGAHWCIDASEEDGTLGRLVNDDHISPNCETKTIVYEGKPHLCLFSVTEIFPGQEITYNYGDSSYPWRSMDCYDGSSASHSVVTSTPRNERYEDAEAAASYENPGSEQPDGEPSHQDESFANISSQWGFREISSTGLDSFQEMTEIFTLQPGDAGYTLQEDEAAFSLDEPRNVKDYRPRSATQKPRGKSCTTNLNYCYVCGAACTKFARHLLRHAKQEPDIAEAFALSKKSKDRKRLLQDLRNRGNYKHNQEVLKNKSGKLKVRRQPTNEEVTDKTHVHCLYCKGMFARKEMWRHIARCSSRTMSNPSPDGKTRVLGEIALVESQFSHKIPAAVWKMFLPMKQDEIAFAVLNDFLIIQLAQSLSMKHANNPDKYETIRQRLRELGRLLLALHEKLIFSFEEAIKPRNFYKVVEAVKDVARFDRKKQSYNKPSLALNLGHSLKKMGTIVLTGANGNEQTRRETKTFMKLCAREWSQLVSKSALASLSGRRINNPSTISFTSDVQIFYRYLERTSTSAIEGLKMQDGLQVYSALCRVTLSQVAVLNKCAPEVSKMTLKAFQERDDTPRVLSKHFIRIKILSWTGQNVAVLLTSQLVSAIMLLVTKREACGVHQDNPFLFAKPGSLTSLYHVSNCIRAFSTLCCAKNPEHLRSVHLHKHIARVFQILNLENDELHHLAKLLGHDIRADRYYYRLPEAAEELAKISKLLLAMEKGSLERFKGKSLEEIEIEDELELDVEQGDPENSLAEEDNEEQSTADPVKQGAPAEEQTRRLTPEQDAVEHIKSCRDKLFLEKMFIDSQKGRGVFTRESIEPFTFVVEYCGNIFSHKDTRAKKRGDTLNNYVFDFSWKGTNWCIDATKEDGTLGRLVNDDHISPNCEMKKIVCEGKPHLCLFAVRRISPGEEITYNYGNSSYPWRSTGSSDEVNTSQTDLNAAESSAEDESFDDFADSYSDDEYVPEGELSSDDSSTSENNQKRENFKNNPDAGSSRQQSFVQQSADASPAREESDYSADDLTSDVELNHASQTSKNYCYICGKAQSKIARHLFTHRKEEPEIAEVFALPMHSKERSRLLDTLRNRGNYKHNQQVLKTHCGELKVKKRMPNTSFNAKTYAHCLYCKAMYCRRDMWRHLKNCSAKGSSAPLGRGRSKVLTLVAAAESTDSKKISKHVRNLLKDMKKDEITSVIWNDSHILLLAQWVCQVNENKQRNHESLRQRLRLMGRLLITLRKKSIFSFGDAVKTQNFPKVVEAVMELAGFDEEKKSCRSPSLRMKLGNSFKKMSEINFAKVMKEDAGKQKIEEAETFMNLCAKEWGTVPTVKSTINNPTIPFIHDVQLLYQCMEKITDSAVESLTMYESPPVYNALLRVTVAQISVMNKNIAEVSKATFKSFSERDETHEEAAGCSSQLDQILSKQSVKINIRSTRGKKLVVTLTPKLLAAIMLLVSKRESCGVHKSNAFLFARPVDIAMSFYRGHQCLSTFIARCGAKNVVNLRSSLFRKHTARIFKILSFTSEDLDEVAKLLGHDIRTDREYYQTPEAAGDIAKILELLSAMENGSLGRFEGKSLEDVEIADELEPDMEEGNHENSEAEEENEESESGPSSSKGSSSKTKKDSRRSSLRKRGRGSRRRQESDNEPSEVNDETNTERGDWSEEMPPCCDVNTPEGTLARRHEDATKISFSDDDEDLNMDFDMDTDEDNVRNEDNDGNGDANSSAAEPMTPNIQDMTKQDSDRSDTKRSGDSQTQNEQITVNDKRMDGNNRRTSDNLNTEKKNKLSAAVAGMKDLRISIPKLDIDKLQHPVHISELSSVCNSIKCPVRDQPVCDAKTPTTSSSSAGLRNKPSTEKVIQMTCSHCKKTMMKGQTAYQKKGFTDVFCSKHCLFEMFPVNKPATKTCHKCLKAISQPLDLIMAAVDTKGTIKDFCSIPCLSAFKSDTLPPEEPPSVCGMCMKSCTATCELTLNGAVHKFCSDSCSEEYRRENGVTCEHCSSTCRNQPLTLKLEEGTKTACRAKCLREITEKIMTAHQCTLCHTSQPVSDMVHHRRGDGVVKLFCTCTCEKSYSLWPTDMHQPEGSESSAQWKRGKRDTPAKQQSNTENVNTTSDSAANGQESPEVFCSSSCFNKYRTHAKKCYNCFQVIARPHAVILAPVDDSGTMKELCSNTCLLSVNSKRSLAVPKPPPPPAEPRSGCRMCARFCFCKFKLTLNGLVHKICNEACFVEYHRVNNLPMLTCNVCSSTIYNNQHVMTLEDGSKTICSKECMAKFKEQMESRRLCPMCQTHHQMSDMVEFKNNEGSLDFFCSHRCMMMHKAQSVTVSGKNSAALDENNIKEVKLLPKLQCIKEEPIDEESTPELSSSMFTEDIKDEPNFAKEGLKIDSVFSLTEDSRSTASTLTRMHLPASCSNCNRVLTDAETVYQRMSHADIFCSTSCLVTFYQEKQAKKTCHFCLQAITQAQGVLQARVDTEQTVKDFCSQICLLSSFNHKSTTSVKIPSTPVASQSQCSMCSRYCISKHEIVQEDVIHKLCSNPCFHHFCITNNLSICENCCSHCKTPVILKVEGHNKILCSAECLAQFKQKLKPRQPCTMCSTPHLVSEMVENKNSEDELELFCTKTCVIASKIHAIGESGIPLNCANCDKITVPACHLSMSDDSIRSVCSLSCAMTFKETQRAAANSPGASDRTDFLKPPEKLLCAQCRRILRTTPRVVQKKGKMNFVCSQACSQAFTKVNNIMGKCEHCENEKIIRDVKRVDDKDCYFCSDGCLMLFGDELGRKWGEYCQSCAYCLCISKTVVTAQYRGTKKKFCSEECNSNYKMLFCHIAKCDTCGCEGKLRQSLPMLGEVKHFCEMKCLLHFCNKKVQMVNTVSSPPRSAGTAESSPVITNVISLASILSRNPSGPPSSAQHVSDIQTKVVGHASVQTVPKELKNKSVLCTPLVHNKGVSCTTQTVDTEAQTDNFGPQVVVLPVPVPVYVPMPMNMYSQYTPQPVGLPLPLPVPVFVPVTPDGTCPTVTSVTERVQPDSEGELSVKESEMKRAQDEDIETEEGPRHREVTEDTLKDHQATSNNREDSDTSFDSLARPHTHESGMPSELPPPAPETRDDPQSPTQPPSLLEQSVGRVQSRLSSPSKACGLQHLSNEQQTTKRKAVSRKCHKLKSQCGIAAWRRWTQWRESGTNLDPVSSPSVAFKEDVLLCSTAELSDALCCFIAEVRRPNGAPYSPDSLFYLCLSIQQYLFENGRVENIFSDLIYNKFSVEFTKILRGFKPAVTAGGYIHSRVEEEFLWDCKQLGAYSPIVLLNTLLFFCCKFFGFTTVEQHRQLSFAHVMRCTKTNQDNTKTTFLRFYPPISSNEAESDGVPAKKRRRSETKEKVLQMMENTENPLHCPVRLYEFYLSKCSESARQRSNVFYLHPDHTSVPNSALWFTSRPLDCATMEAMLVRILVIQELWGGNGRGLDPQASDDTSSVSDEEDSEG